MTLLLRFIALCGLASFACALHHGHVMMFLDNVYELVEKGLGRRFEKRRWERLPSTIRLRFDSETMHYAATVQRKSRSIDVGQHFVGVPAKAETWAQHLASYASSIQAALGPAAELERWSSKRTSLHEQHLVHNDAWKPKRDLTPELAQTIAARLSQYVEVLEPIVANTRTKS